MMDFVSYIFSYLYIFFVSCFLRFFLLFVGLKTEMLLSEPLKSGRM